MINVYQFHYEEIENKKYLLNKTFCFFLVSLSYFLLFYNYSYLFTCICISIFD